MAVAREDGVLRVGEGVLEERGGIRLDAQRTSHPPGQRRQIAQPVVVARHEGDLHPAREPVRRRILLHRSQEVTSRLVLGDDPRQYRVRGFRRPREVAPVPGARGVVVEPRGRRDQVEGIAQEDDLDLLGIGVASMLGDVFERADEGAHRQVVLSRRSVHQVQVAEEHDHGQPPSTSLRARPAQKRSPEPHRGRPVGRPVGSGGEPKAREHYCCLLARRFHRQAEIPLRGR